MTKRICEVFAYLFLFGHGFSFPVLVVGSCVLPLFAFGFLSGDNIIVHYCLVAVGTVAPTAMALTFNKPKFQAHRAVESEGEFTDLELLLEHAYLFKVRAINLYEKWYTPTLRVAYGLFALIMFLAARILLHKVFVPEVVGLITLNGIFSIVVICTLSLWNHFASRNQAGTPSS